MTKRRRTRRALINSIISLIICFSMLLGTTFAWFTDSVSSTNNIIKAGNLDVELYYQAEGQTDWTKVTENTNVFKENTLWEPGHTEVVKLKVVNEGTLALKYQLGVNIAEELGSISVKTNEAFKLSEFIKYGIVAGAQPYTRETAVAAVDATAMQLMNAYNSETIELLPKTESNSDNEDIVTMVVYMPTTIGNEANHAKDAAQPTIKLGINLFAAQLNYENDSFGDDYDEGLNPNVTYVSNFSELQQALATGKSVALMSDVVMDASTEFMYTSGNGALLYVKDAEVTIDLNGHDIVVESDALMEGKDYSNAVILVNRSTLDIIGDGNIIANNKSIPVYGLANSTINIYGGTYKTNAYERNESAIYVNNPNVMINVYGGNFDDSVYAFNVHDSKCGNTPVITLHEGVSYADFLKNNTTDVIASDINAGRIVLAENTYLKNYEQDGKIWHEVAEKQDGVIYIHNHDDLTAGRGYSNSYVLDDDLDADDYIYFGDNTDNRINLNGNTIIGKNENQWLFVGQGANCTLTIEGDGTVDVHKGIYASSSGTVVINGGTYLLGETTEKSNFYAQNSGTIVINGGNFISDDANKPIAYCINGFIEINGGFFQNTANPNKALLDMGNNLNYINNQKITLRGGTFVNWNPMDSAFARPWTNPDVPALIVLADGYEIVSETQTNGDIWYTVAPAE